MGAGILKWDRGIAAALVWAGVVLVVSPSLGIGPKIGCSRFHVLSRRRALDKVSSQYQFCYSVGYLDQLTCIKQGGECFPQCSGTCLPSWRRKRASRQQSQRSKLVSADS